MFGAAGPWKEAYGAATRRGIELALADIKARGGIDGRTLRIAWRDDEGDGEQAALIARDFVADASVSAVIGHVNSGAMVAAAKVYDGQLAAVATTATAPELSGISPWAFRVISSDSVNGVDLARYASALGHRRAAILYENDAYGRGLTDAFRRAFAGEILSADPIAAGEQDFEPYVTWFKQVRPDIVFVAGTEVSGIALLREARRQELESDFLGGDGWLGIVVDTAASNGAYVGAPFTAADPRPEVRRFVAAYRQLHGEEPDGNAALAYDATMLLAQAVEETGPDREEIRDYLAALGRDDGYPGVTGRIRFSGTGDPVGKGFVMTRVINGALAVAGLEQ